MVGDVMAFSGGKTLTVYVAADLKKFNAGMAQAQSGLVGFSLSLKNMLGPAAIGAGFAIAGLATKMAVDGVNAALDDEAAMRKLAVTLENVGVAHDTQKIEDFISVLERSTGVADDELRPAYDRLIRSIGDTATANDMLKLSMDISAGTGKSLQAVTEALGKAYDGNISGLSRLGAGIDASIIKSGNMEAITLALSDTFSGQAAESADTFRGRLKVMNQAVDNLGEAFGRGLLGGIESATDGTDRFAQKLADLEPKAEAAGSTVGNVGLVAANVGASLLGAYGNTLQFIRGLQGSQNVATRTIAIFNPLGVMAALVGDDLNAAADGADAAAKAIGLSAYEARNAVPQWNDLSGAVRMSTQDYIAYLNAHSVGNSIIKAANKDYQDLGARQRDVNSYVGEYTLKQEKAAGATGSTSSAVEELTAKEKELTKAFETNNETLKTNRTDLAFWTGELTKANDAITGFTTSMQENLLAGVDLGAAYSSAKTSGGDLGAGVVAGFETMINDAKWFGNVLETLQSQGVDQSLIDYLATQGAEIGGGLGEAMLGDKGLLASLNEKWMNVQATTKTLAEGLVPEFMIAGQESALTMIDTISETMAKEVNRLAKIGKKIAQPLGSAFRAELMSDVAAALKEVEAAGTAGRAEAVANAQQRQVALTNAAVAQALQNLVRSADARNGAPITPVLG
jgi:hypothetical protein